MPHPCRCRICKRMDWETHALLAELARHIGCTQGEVLRECVREEARARRLLPAPREPKRDPFRSAQRVELATRIHSQPSPRSNGKPSNSPVRGAEPQIPPLHPFREHQRQSLAKLSKWERYFLEDSE